MTDRCHAPRARRPHSGRPTPPKPSGPTPRETTVVASYGRDLHGRYDPPRPVCADRRANPSCPPVSSPGRAPPYRIHPGPRSSERIGKIGKTRVPHLPCRSPLPTTEGYREITPARQADCGRKIGDRGRTRVCPAWPPSPGRSKTRQDPAPGEVLRRKLRGTRALERVPAPIHKDRGRHRPQKVPGRQGGTGESLPSSHSTTGSGS